MAKPSKQSATALVRPPVIVPPQISAVPRNNVPRPEGAPPLEIAPPPKPVELVYSWPSKVRCPHCDRTDCQVNGVSGAIRYMRCRHASCRRTFKVQGTLI